MEFICTDDQGQPQAVSAVMDIQDQDHCLSENTMPEIEVETGNASFGACKENETILITQPEKLTRGMSEGVILCSPTATTDQDLAQGDCCDFLKPIVSLDGVYTCLNNDSSTAARSTATLAPASVVSTAETMTGQSLNDIVLSASCKSDDCHATDLLRSLSHSSNDSDSDIPAARLSELYIFESEAHDFILSPEPNPQDIQCPQAMPLSQTVADISFTTYEAGDSSRAVTKYDQDLSDDQIIVQCELGESNSPRLGSPAIDACDVAQTNTDAVSKTTRNDSPVELWLDACPYFTVDETEDRNLSIQSVMQDSMTITSDFSVPTEETQRSGYSQNACEMIGWSFDDKSWGPPVERWSSVDSWASALSDWTEIISSPAEDLTAAFTEIGAEIDALTQALAEVTTQIEAELQSEKADDVLDKSIMGVQDKPSDSQNIAEVSGNTGQSGLIQERERTGCTRTTELKQSDHLEPQKQFMGSCEVTASEMFNEDTRAQSVTHGAAFEADTGLLDVRFDSLVTDLSNDVILNIQEDTDCEHRRPSNRLQISEPDGDNKCEVKYEASLSSLDFVAEQDTGRICTTSKTLNVIHQRNKTQGTPFLNTPTPTNVPEVYGEPGLNVHLPPNTLADFDGACQVEPLWGSPKFIIPLAPLSSGSSLVTQATRSSLNEDQEPTSLCRDSVYDPSEVLDCQPESDEVTDFSSESSEEIASSEHPETDSSSDLKPGEISQCYFTKGKSIFEEGRDLLNLAVIPNDHFIVSDVNRVACFTLDLYDPFAPLVTQSLAERMPHKTHKSSTEGKTRSKKERPAGQPHGVHTCRKQENLNKNVEAGQQPHTLKENLTREQDNKLEHTEPAKETGVAPHKEMGRRHSKKKKKHTGKSTAELLAEAEYEVNADTAKADILKEKSPPKGVDQPIASNKNIEKPETPTVSNDKQSQKISVPNVDDIIKKRRLAQDKFGKIVSSLESKLTKGDTSKGVEDKANVGTTRRKAYSEVVKQKPIEPKVVQPIQAVSVSGDPQSLCLYCQFSDLLTDYTITWRKDRTTLSEIKRSAGDESRISLTISNACHKDLGKYQCELRSAHKVVTLDFQLTYELLSEIVIPATPKTTPSAPLELGHEEESVHCSRLMFKEDFLAEQYFGESHSASILTEKIHFGEGMHRRAFRTTLQAGQIPLLVQGHSCVLKVHNAISYGTKNNEELVEKNFNLAVEECQVQNTAREYIKAYNTVAQSFDAFGPVPEIIPIYLVHRPSNDIPYATLEEELIGDFVKYSVKDGKEINLMRKDSEAGQKCCAFQHWVYHHTEGNLLVTDMQGVGMRLTDVGIATCKKGYRGFKGNCATSFIDQFKALHQCNNYCEILGLKSLQPKPKKSAPVPKTKPDVTPKKKMFELTAKGKS